MQISLAGGKSVSVNIVKSAEIPAMFIQTASGTLDKVHANKERIQIFKGVVIQIKGTGTTKTFTVRKMSGNVGVERIIPFNSPYIHAIEVNKRGVVRRSRIFYFRELTGKKAKIKEKKF